MEGSTSEVGYKFRSDLERANVRGDPESQFMTNRAVSVLEEQGELRKILFWVEYPEQFSDEDRYVQVRVYDDGHITVSQPVRSHLFDDIELHIERLRGYRGYLQTLDELQDEFMRDAYRTESTDRRQRIRQQMVQSFDRMLDTHFDTSEYSNAEMRVFRSILANLGIAVIRNGLPNIDEVDSVSETEMEYLDPEAPVENGVREFFINYADYELDNQSLDYEVFVDHLRPILEIRKDLDPDREDEYTTWKKPLSVISEITERYDIE
jgi:hypothetical protein